MPGSMNNLQSSILTQLAGVPSFVSYITRTDHHLPENIESIGRQCPASSLSTSSRLTASITEDSTTSLSLRRLQAAHAEVKRDKGTTVSYPTVKRLSESVRIATSAKNMPRSSSTEQDSKGCPRHVSLVVTKCLQMMTEQQYERQMLLEKKNAREKHVKKRKSIESLEEAPISQTDVATTLADSGVCGQLWVCFIKCLKRLGDFASFVKTTFCGTFRFPLDLLRKLHHMGLSQAFHISNTRYANAGSCDEVVELEHYGQGSFHDVWLVTFPLHRSRTEELLAFPNHLPAKCVIRIRKEHSITDATPMYVRHEVGMRQFVTRNLGNVPTPRIYGWNDGDEFGVPYTIEEYVQGVPLCVVWKDFDDEQMDKVLQNLGHILLELAKPDFTHIGGMDPTTYGIGPHLEPCMTHDDRIEVYDPEKWNVGPYSSTKEYVLAMYEKESQFWESGIEATNWSEDWGTVYGTPATFAKYLRKKKTEIEHGSERFPLYERFNISHGDLAGRNILVMGTDIVSIIDWEFASILPANQFFRQTAVDEPPLQLYSSPAALTGDGSEEHMEAWQSDSDDYHAKNHAAMRQLKGHMIAEAEKRGWGSLEIGYLLRGWGAAESGKVQRAMQPFDDLEYPKYVLEEAAAVPANEDLSGSASKEKGELFRIIREDGQTLVATSTTDSTNVIMLPLKHVLHPPQTDSLHRGVVGEKQGSSNRKRNEKKKKAAKRRKRLEQDTNSSKTSLSTWARPIARKNTAKTGTFAVLDSEQYL